MKIMEIISGKEVNGAMRHCLLLSRELVRRGHEVILVSRQDSWIRREIGDGPIEVLPSDLHRFPTDELRRVAGVIRQRGIDVVHTHMSRAHFFGVLLRWFSGVPSVATAHSRLFQLHWMFNDFVIAVCESTRRYHCRVNFLRRSRTITIPNFLDDQWLQPAPPETRPDVRRWLGVEDEVLLVGAIGDVDSRKNQLCLLRAWPKILAAAPNARLLIVGEGKDRPYRERMIALADQMALGKSVQWIAHHNDVKSLMCGLDLLVLASRQESLPMVILEAMASGVPVVATDVGGVSECVTSGRTGVLVRPNDSPALAEAMIGMLTDSSRRRQMGEAGRQYAWEHFSADHQTAAIEAVFRRVIAARKAA